MNRGPPFFVALNNPGAHAERWAVRALTLHDYAARHLELLLNPSAPQCCDRSHHALPLVQAGSRDPPQGSAVGRRSVYSVTPSGSCLASVPFDSQSRDSALHGCKAVPALEAYYKVDCF